MSTWLRCGERTLLSGCWYQTGSLGVLQLDLYVGAGSGSWLGRVSASYRSCHGRLGVGWAWLESRGEAAEAGACSWGWGARVPGVGRRGGACGGSSASTLFARKWYIF